MENFTNEANKITNILLNNKNNVPDIYNILKYTFLRGNEENYNAFEEIYDMRILKKSLAFEALGKESIFLRRQPENIKTEILKIKNEMELLRTSVLDNKKEIKKVLELKAQNIYNKIYKSNNFTRLKNLDYLEEVILLFENTSFIPYISNNFTEENKIRINWFIKKYIKKYLMNIILKDYGLNLNLVYTLTYKDGYDYKIKCTLIGIGREKDETTYVLYIVGANSKSKTIKINKKQIIEIEDIIIPDMKLTEFSENSKDFDIVFAEKHDYLEIAELYKNKTGGSKKINLKNNTIVELKNICKKNKLKNYSKLRKDDLIKLLKKNK